MSGCFPFTDTYGIPLEVVVEYLSSHGMMVDWLDYYRTGVESGNISPEQMRIRLTAVVGDVYGPTFREEWERRFLRVIMRE